MLDALSWFDVWFRFLQLLAGYLTIYNKPRVKIPSRPDSGTGCLYKPPDPITFLGSEKESKKKDKEGRFWSHQMAEEKSFKYVIVGGGVAAVSLCSLLAYESSLCTAHSLAIDLLFKKN